MLKKKFFFGQNFFSKGDFPRTNSGGGGRVIEWSNFAFQGGVDVFFRVGVRTPELVQGAQCAARIA